MKVGKMFDENIDVNEVDQPLLLESVNHVDKKDKERLLNIIQRPSMNGKYVLKTYHDYPDDEKTIEWISSSKKLLLMQLNLDLTETANFICDVCDEYGYKFKIDIDRKINTISFTIYKK